MGEPTFSVHLSSTRIKQGHGSCYGLCIISELLVTNLLTYTEYVLPHLKTTDETPHTHTDTHTHSLELGNFLRENLIREMTICDCICILIDG